MTYKNFLHFFWRDHISEKIIPPATGSPGFYPIVSWSLWVMKRSPHDYLAVESRYCAHSNFVLSCFDKNRMTYTLYGAKKISQEQADCLDSFLNTQQSLELGVTVAIVFTQVPVFAVYSALSFDSIFMVSTLCPDSKVSIFSMCFHHLCVNRSPKQ